MDDNTLMPWGIYKGIAMANVPADYLISIRKKGCSDKEVAEYIEDNYEILISEMKKK